MSRTFRHYWPDRFQGRVWVNFNLPGVIVKSGGAVHAVSGVVISACEYEPGPGLFAKAGVMKKGDANIWVSNVHPYVRDNQATDPVTQNGGVEFVINVDYFSPLLIATTITVFDEVVDVRLGEEL